MFIRNAKLSDSESIHELANHYSEKGLVLARSRSSIYEEIRNYAVAEEDGEVIGVGALCIIWADLAEVRTLAVNEKYSRQGVGKKLVEHFIEEAKAFGIKKVFTLTYQTAFFEKCAFKMVTKDHMPHKIWRDCLNCPKFPDCDEELMEIVL